MERNKENRQPDLRALMEARTKLYEEFESLENEARDFMYENKDDMPEYVGRNFYNHAGRQMRGLVKDHLDEFMDIGSVSGKLEFSIGAGTVIDLKEVELFRFPKDIRGQTELPLNSLHWFYNWRGIVAVINSLPIS